MTLAAERVAVRYGERVAVAPTSLALRPCELVALVGPNGAGKSTLLKALVGLAPATGTVTLGGEPLAAIDAPRRARSIAYLPQAPNVHWPLPARELVALGRLPHRAYGTRVSAADSDAIDAAMAQTGTTGFAARSVDRLSIGERARVLLARALAVEAPVLLVDEPVAMLDPFHQLEIMTTLRDYAHRGPATTGRGTPAVVVAVLHDLTLAARFCDRVLLMHDGAVVRDAEPREALGAEALEQHYKVEAWLATHDGDAVIVPWRALHD